ncbi:MAG: FAD synthase, partial [Bacteroidales bacterium]|nr:FAD synthase [Bacteroidales bacterium]
MAVVATGFFDGVHLGHRQVIKQLVDAAKTRGDESVIVTFWPHPRTVLQDGARSLRLLNSLDEKKALL